MEIVYIAMVAVSNRPNHIFCIIIFSYCINTVCFILCCKLAVASSTDTTTETTMHSNLDLRQHVRTDQGGALSEHPTTVAILPIAARLVKNEYDDDNIANELDGDNGKAVDSTNDETVATVIPVSPNATNNSHPNEARITYDIETVTIQTNMQRNATISRDQLNLLGVIKSSSSSSSSASSSAMANNNATNQKQHKPDAPMLNYIFDAHLTNKHRHYDPRYVKLFRFTFTSTFTCLHLKLCGCGAKCECPWRRKEYSCKPESVQVEPEKC